MEVRDVIVFLVALFGWATVLPWLLKRHGANLVGAAAEVVRDIGERADRAAARNEALAAKVAEYRAANEQLFDQLAAANSKAEMLEDLLYGDEDDLDSEDAEYLDVYLDEDEDGNVISPLGDTVPACLHGEPVDDRCERCEVMVERSREIGEGEAAWLRTFGAKW